jgi:hypothetical protein
MFSNTIYFADNHGIKRFDWRKYIKFLGVYKKISYKEKVLACHGLQGYVWRPWHAWNEEKQSNPRFRRTTVSAHTPVNRDTSETKPL